MKVIDDLDPRKGLQGPKQRVLSREVFYTGHNIIEQGDEGYRAYYLERGRVEVLIKDGKHLLKVAEMGPGDLFGEMALITNEPRSATVRALEECVLTVISRDEIEGKIDGIRDPAIRALISVLAERLRDSTKGQMTHYKSLAEFQDKIGGIIDVLDKDIDEKKRDAFRGEAAPLLEELQRVIDRYKG